MPRKDLETSALSYRKHPGMYSSKYLCGSSGCNYVCMACYEWLQNYFHGIF